jgi:hypothetical protein
LSSLLSDFKFLKAFQRKKYHFKINPNKANLYKKGAEGSGSGKIKEINDLLKVEL